MGPLCTLLTGRHGKIIQCVFKPVFSNPCSRCEAAAATDIKLRLKPVIAATGWSAVCIWTKMSSVLFRFASVVSSFPQAKRSVKVR